MNHLEEQQQNNNKSYFSDEIKRRLDSGTLLEFSPDLISPALPKTHVLQQYKILI
jgi:hypothetical protein